MTAATTSPDPIPAACPAWCMDTSHRGDEGVKWSNRRVSRPGFVEASRTCTREMGTIDASESTMSGEVSVSLNRFQYFDNEDHVVQAAVVLVEVMDGGSGTGLDREQSTRLQQLLNAANIMLAEPETPFQHYRWCIFAEGAPSSDDCGPNGRDCTTADHRVPVRSCSLAGAGGMNDGGALHATLTNTADHGPTITLVDQIGIKDSAFPAWELHPDEAEVLGNYLLALAVQGRQEGANR